MAPPKAPKTYSLSVRFSEEDAEQIERLSEERDVSAAHIVREAVREYLDRHAKKKSAPKK